LFRFIVRLWQAFNRLLAFLSFVSCRPQNFVSEVHPSIESLMARIFLLIRILKLIPGSHSALIGGGLPV
jgi:hypothetical protein